VNGLSTLVQPAYPNGAPKHKVVGTATARLYRRTMLVASALYEAGVHYQNDGGNNTTLRPPLAAPNFATVDLGGSTPIYKGMNFQAGVKNLFDRYYLVSGRISGRRP
jgi:outer membrane receptor protein involved in Fe transport